MCQLIITGTSFVYNYFEKHRIFSFIDIVEPFLPIELQITVQIICVIKGIINLLYNKLKYRAIMNNRNEKRTNKNDETNQSVEGNGDSAEM